MSSAPTGVSAVALGCACACRTARASMKWPFATPTTASRHAWRCREKATMLRRRGGPSTCRSPTRWCRTGSCFRRTETPTRGSMRPDCTATTHLTPMTSCCASTRSIRNGRPSRWCTKSSPTASRRATSRSPRPNGRAAERGQTCRKAPTGAVNCSAAISTGLPSISTTSRDWVPTWSTSPRSSPPAARTATTRPPSTKSTRCWAATPAWRPSPSRRTPGTCG